jgi:hypothetical protein
VIVYGVGPGTQKTKSTIVGVVCGFEPGNLCATGVVTAKDEEEEARIAL